MPRVLDSHRLAFVDALRGIAVLGVLLSHTPLPSNLGRLNFMGAHGVQLFFVMSAFTLFLSMASKAGLEKRAITNFFIRRVFRIAPAFYAAALLYLFKDGLGASFWAPNGINIAQILTTFTFTHGWHPETINSIVPGGWSIAVEMTFYLVVPLCFIVIRDLRFAFITAGGLVILGVSSSRMLVSLLTSPGTEPSGLTNYFAQLWFPAQACVFPLGFVLFFLYKSFDPSASARLLAAGLVALSAYLCIAFSNGGYALIPSHFLYGVAFVLLGWGLMIYPLSFLVNPITRYIGKVSFSVYLFHFWAIDLIKHNVGPTTSGIPGVASSLLFYGALVSISVAIATVTYHLIEKPGQDLGKELIRRLEARAA